MAWLLRIFLGLRPRPPPPSSAAYALDRSIQHLRILKCDLMILLRHEMKIIRELWYKNMYSNWLDKKTFCRRFWCSAFKNFPSEVFRQTDSLSEVVGSWSLRKDKWKHFSAMNQTFTKKSEAGVALKVTVALRFLVSHSTYAIRNCILATGLLETVGRGASARNTLLKFVHF